MQKLCSNCSQSAKYSLAFVLSSLGNNPRVQKCSPPVLFCDDCLHDLGEYLCTGGLRQAFNNAYTELKRRCGNGLATRKGSGS
jgi:hypothetical protein